MEKIPYEAGIYIRISKEDGEKLGEESNSIGNQRSYIRSFLKEREDIHIYKEYVDDGCTGVSFDRPSMKQLLEDVKNKKVNCIIVKDLSRFGRNYIETGRYIEQIFPFLGVRFLSINDGYDSETLSHSDNIMIPFKNLMNDMYSRDISMKRRSQIEARYQQGDFIGAFPVYGYFRSHKDKHKLEIDPYAAAAVRDIFKWKIEGLSSQKIADRLNQQGVLSPYEYKRALGWAYSTSFKLGAVSMWSPQSVGRILRNQKYIGDMVQGMEWIPNYKRKKRAQKPKSHWVIVENTHEAIISKEDFYLVQRLLQEDTRTAPKKEELYALSGLLKCGNCKKSMIRKPVQSGNSVYVYYVCRTHKNNKGLCKMGSMVNEEPLKRCVLQMLQMQMAVLGEAKEWLPYIDGLPLKKNQVPKVEERLTKKQEEFKYYQRLLIELEKDHKSGILTWENYNFLKNSYEKRMKEIHNSIPVLERNLENLVRTSGEQSDGLHDFIQNANIHELNRAAAALFIEEIVVKGKNKIQIRFSFQWEYKKVWE